MIRISVVVVWFYGCVGKRGVGGIGMVGWVGVVGIGRLSYGGVSIVLIL